MDFSFGRQISKDSLLNKTGEASRSLRSSLTSGSSRLLDSVKSKKTGFFDGISSGISNTFDQVMTMGGGKEDEEDQGLEESVQVESPPSPATRVEKPKPATRQPSPKQRPPTERQQNAATSEQQSVASMQPQRQPQPTPKPKPQPLPSGQPQKPASRQTGPKTPPARPVRPPIPSPRNKSNGSIRGQPGPGKFSRQQTAPADYDPSGDSEFSVNTDNAPYGRHYSLRSGSVDLDQDSGFQDTASSIGGGSNTSPADGLNAHPPMASTRISKNPFLNDPMPDSEFTTVFTKAEVYNSDHAMRGDERAISDLDPVARVRAANNPGSDLLPGIPRVPSNNVALLGPQQPAGRDLLAITPTSGEALPMPGLEPIRHMDSDEIYDLSDGDSEDTEGCDEAPDPEDYGGADYDYGSEGPMFRSGSVGSEQSWHSNQSEENQLDYAAKACRDFMKGFVAKIFSTNDGVSQGDKATYGQFCQQPAGRLCFARYVNAQRVNSKSVPEDVFYSLVQYFAVALFECNEADDFTPAKILMNMCFTFYLEVVQQSGPPQKHFLYSYLRDQQVWQSIRFWNAAFFDAVQHERARRPIATRGTGREGQTDDRQYQENITFGQLGTFTCNMRAFGLSKQLCMEFIRKQATIANISEEQVAMLKENVEKGTN